MTAPLEFDGPPNWHCLGQPYVILTHGGIWSKNDGAPIPSGLCETENEAFAKFWVQLEAFQAGAEQIAWRRRPSAETEGDKFKVTARLARFPEENE